MTNSHDWKRDRKSRKRGFDDDAPQDMGWAPPPQPAYSSGPPRRPSAPAASGPDVSAIVKKFDAERGFGFVAVEGGGGDAFMHVSVLQRSGTDTVLPGTRLRVRLGQGERGPQVTEVVEVGPVDEAAARSSFSPSRSPRPAPAMGDGEEMRGTVKWYSGEKGFGFVTPSDGGKDVFVHATALERSGIRTLAEGQAVILRVVQGKKGPEAGTITAA
jgi:CspA family cold shock protein